MKKIVGHEIYRISRVEKETWGEWFASIAVAAMVAVMVLPILWFAVVVMFSI